MMLKKQNGSIVEIDFSLILQKLKRFALLPGHELTNVDYVEIAKQTIAHFGESTTELDEIAALTAADMCTRHYEYSLLAARIWCSRLQKLVPRTFSEATSAMVTNGIPLSSRYARFVKRYANHLNPIVKNERDLYEFDYFGVRTLAKSYLLRVPIAATTTSPSSSTTTTTTTTNPGQKVLSFDGIAETPQQLFMRVATSLTIGNNGDVNNRNNDLDDLTDDQLRAIVDNVRVTYDALSTKRYVHATPTLFTSGLESQTLASCYLLTIGEDSIEGIFEALTRCALVSKASGGIGLNISEIRANGTPIRRTNGRSNGIVPMLRVFNDVARYVDQGGGKRPGAITVYLEPWHADIEDFLRLSKKTGVEEKITRDLFTAVWSCDLFMRRVEANEPWSLMCPHLCPGLTKVWGVEFERLYTTYERNRRYVKRVPAKQLWETMIAMQLETGMPFLLHKDHVNARNNQSNLGTIRGSNLCTEITLFTDRDSVSVCNLASISLPAFTRDATRNFCVCSLQTAKPPMTSMTSPTASPTSSSSSSSSTSSSLSSMTSTSDAATAFGINRYALDCEICHGGFDFAQLFHTVRLAVRNLDRTIDAMNYPMFVAERTNKQCRPLGIGVQGLADVFAKLRLPWNSYQAWTLNERIFETMYRASLQESCALAKEYGSYPFFHGSPASELPARFQHDLYNEWLERFMQTDRDSFNSVDLSGYHYLEEDANDDWLVKATDAECWSWSMLRKMVEFHGLRNSHRLAPMPTASTAQIFGNCESIEPRTSNLFYRRVQSGEFFVINRQLVDDMTRLGIWDEAHRRSLIKNRGSVQHMTDLPSFLREVYRTVWEIPQRVLVNLNAARQPFIDQSSSFNLYFNEPNFARVTNAHFYAWRCGLKTGMYYLRTRPAVEPIQFTVTNDETTTTTTAINDESNATTATRTTTTTTTTTNAAAAPAVANDVTTTTMTSRSMKKPKWRPRNYTVVRNQNVDDISQLLNDDDDDDVNVVVGCSENVVEACSVNDDDTCLMCQS